MSAAIPIGTIVNAAAVVAGSLIGVILKHRYPERVKGIVFQAIGLATIVIGVKMALGAKERQVMLPFVLEALLMTVLGGILGTAVSLGLIAVLAALPLKGEALELLGRPTFSPAIGAATAMVLGAIGSLAGFFPAKHAASVNPAVSLRYE